MKLETNVPQTVLFPFEGHRIGGSHHSGLLLALGLQRYTNYRPRVYCQTDGPVKELAESYGLEVLVSSSKVPPLPLTKVNFLRELRANWLPIRREMNRVAPDAVHTNDPASHVRWSAFLAGIAGHQIIHQRGLRLPALPIPRISSRSLISISRYVDASLGTDLPFEHRTQLPNPLPEDARSYFVNRDAYARHMRSRLGLTSSHILVGYLANYRFEKRPDFFARIAASMVERGQVPGPIAFVMAGSPRDQTRGEVERAANLGPRLRQIGFVADPLSFLAGIDLLIAPALEEPFGRTLIEALAVGTPVLATDEGGHVEILSDLPECRIPATSPPQAWASKVELLISSPRSSVLPTALTEATLEQYSLRRHAEAVANHYDIALKGADIDSGPA